MKKADAECRHRHCLTHSLRGTTFSGVVIRFQLHLFSAGRAFYAALIFVHTTRESLSPVWRTYPPSPPPPTVPSATHHHSQFYRGATELSPHTTRNLSHTRKTLTVTLTVQHLRLKHSFDRRSFSIQQVTRAHAYIHTHTAGLLHP